MYNRLVRRCMIPVTAAGLLFLAGCGSDTGMAGALSAPMEQKVYDLSGDYSRLDIQADLADIVIQPGTAASMEVSLEEGYEMEQVTEDDTLYLTERNYQLFWRKIIHFGSVRNTVVITLPENVIEELVVSSDVSDVTISGQKIRSISVKESSADVILSDCEGDDIQIENTNGNVRLENITADLKAELQNGDLQLLDSSGGSLYTTNQNGNIEASGADYSGIDAACENGNIDLKRVKTDSVSVSNENGNVSLELNGKQAAFDYDITNSNGKVVIGNSTVGTFQTEFQFSNNAGKQLTADMGNGDLTVTFLEEAQE